MRRLIDLAAGVALVVVTLTSAATLVGSLADGWWLGQLLSQPRPQYALALLACLPVLLARFRRAGWLVLIPLAVNVASFAPLYFGRSAAALAPTHPLALLHYNLDNTALDHGPAFDYLRNHPADILSLQELTPELDRRLSAELPAPRPLALAPCMPSVGAKAAAPP